MTLKLSGEPGARGGFVWYTQKLAKIAEVHATAWRLAMKTWVKPNFLKKFVKRALAKFSMPFENSKHLYN
jgi:hypothetical protein